ncbi:hypothetical protein [Streptomyces sp. NPDC058086]|uniref:hypothetical protein n=1 Tax=Streptomyces sp. NPDC058086 TaxID=3346334 RepID=UPI0036E55DC0
MPLSPPAPERAQQLLAQLERYGSHENGKLAVGRRLLQDHPDLPLTGLAISRSTCPEPGRPLHSLILRVGEHDTDGITAWARALGTEPVIDGARCRHPGRHERLLPRHLRPASAPVRWPRPRRQHHARLGPVRRLSHLHRMADSQRFGGSPGTLPVIWMYAQDGHTQDFGSLDRCPACERPSRGLDYHPETRQRVHACPFPACRHQWPVTDTPWPAPIPAATEHHHDVRAALATR